jgi:RNA-directed DNA polymerase
VTSAAPKLGIQRIKYLCYRLNLPEDVIRQAADSHEALYRKNIPITRRGKTRLVNQPLGMLRLVQRRLLEVLRTLPISRAIIGGVPGQDNIANARIHVCRRRVLCLDLASFFNNISRRRVFHWFLSADCSPKVASTLTKIVTLDGCVPHGGITSTLIAALTAHRLTIRLEQLALSREMRFTQYVDDLTFSGRALNMKFADLVNRIVEEEGFQTKAAKTKLFLEGEEHVVTGVRVDKRLDVPTKYLAEVKAEFDGLAARVSQGEIVGTGELRRIRGKVAYVRRLNKRRARDLKYRHLLPTNDRIL